MENAADFYMIIDDDLLVTPSQLDSLCQQLYRDPQNVHGLFGAQYRVSEEEYPSIYVKEVDKHVDILNRIYAFSRETLERCFVISDWLIDQYPDKYSSNSPCLLQNDDIVLSFSGLSRPRVHRLGKVATDITGFSNDALSRNSEFMARRVQLIKDVRLCLQTISPCDN
jgi:hypothetical protein